MPMQQSDRRLRALLPLALGICLCAADSRGAAAALSLERPLEIGLLYDNSGSMYPGYAPPGRPGTPRSVSGAQYFHQYPEVQEWLSDFVARQTILNGGHVSMSVLTSGREFHPSDLRQVHPRVPVAAFDVRRAVTEFPSPPGDMTYLTEGLDRFTRGFEGLVWLITDNIVETRLGQADREVERFFRSLRDERRYRSVHLFKYPFRDPRTGQSAALAIYGIVVSNAEVPPSVLTFLDRKLRSDFRFANRRRGNPPPPLFPGREHLKLKDLSVDALELETAPSLEVVIESRDRSLFREKQNVRLELGGVVRSYLTQHSVTAGRYTLELEGALAPDEASRRRLGLVDFPAGTFQTFSGTLSEPIPPNGSQNVASSLQSRTPLSMSFDSFTGWLRAAFSGAVVTFTGTVKMSFGDVQVRLERDRLAGIYGIESASSIFDLQDVRSIRVEPSRTQISFDLETSSQRTWLLLLVLAVLGVPAVLSFLALRRPQRYRIEVSGSPATVVALRRLGGHEVVHEGQRLGRLSRGFASGYNFAPTTGSATIAVTPAGLDGAYDVRIRDRRYRLAIEPLGAGATRQPTSGRPGITIATAGSAVPGPPATRGTAQPPTQPGPPTARPKIGRP